MFALFSTVLADFNAPEWMFFGWFGLIALGLLVLLVGTVFWLWMLVDAIRNPALDDAEKIVWTVVIVALHFVGGLVYFFAARDKRLVGPRN